MPPPTIMQIILRHWALCAVTGMLAQLFQPLSLAYGQGQIEEDDHSQPQTSEQPSRELLEFLLEYGDLDDDSFELIVVHGKRDSELNSELGSELDSELADEQKQTGSKVDATGQTLPHSKELVDDH